MGVKAFQVLSAAILAVAALALFAYGVVVFSAVLAGSSDTALWVLVGFGAICVLAGTAAGWGAWRLTRRSFRGG
jgi:hypothetical protein